MEQVESLDNSADLYILLICFTIAGRCTLNSLAIRCALSQIVSLSSLTSIHRKNISGHIGQNVYYVVIF